MPSSRGSSQPRSPTLLSEPPEKPGWTSTWNHCKDFSLLLVIGLVGHVSQPGIIRQKGKDEEEVFSLSLLPEVHQVTQNPMASDRISIVRQRNKLRKWEADRATDRIWAFDTLADSHQINKPSLPCVLYETMHYVVFSNLTFLVLAVRNILMNKYNLFISSIILCDYFP